MEKGIVPYYLYTKKELGKDFIKIFLCSDIHFSNSFDLSVLYKLETQIVTFQPDFICIPGDILDYVDIKDISPLLSWLDRISQYGKIILGIGNHEQLIFNGSKPIPYRDYLQTEFFQKIKQISNLVLLHNNCYEEQYISFTGYTAPIEFHEQHHENKEYFLEDISNYSFPVNHKNYVIGFYHDSTPVLESSPGQIPILDNTDLILSGHIHGGLTPEFFKKIIQKKYGKNAGLIDAVKNLFPTYAQGIVTKGGFTNIISAGVTKIPDSMPNFTKPFRCMYPMNAYQITIEQEKTYTLGTYPTKK